MRHQQRRGGAGGDPGGAAAGEQGQNGGGEPLPLPLLVLAQLPLQPACASLCLLMLPQASAGACKGSAPADCPVLLPPPPPGGAALVWRALPVNRAVQPHLGPVGALWLPAAAAGTALCVLARTRMLRTAHLDRGPSLPQPSGSGLARSWPLPEPFTRPPHAGTLMWRTPCPPAGRSAAARRSRPRRRPSSDPRPLLPILPRRAAAPA